MMLRTATARLSPLLSLSPLSTISSLRLLHTTTPTEFSAKSLITEKSGGLHGTMKSTGAWRNKPLFRREGDARFKTGQEASKMLIGEAIRRDANELEFIGSVSSALEALGTVFERSPKYAWVAKQLLEPERALSFRVAWIDDTGIARTNRGYRVQYSSALGCYEGSLHFGRHVNSSVLKSLGFDAIFSNAIAGFHAGAAVGGSDFNPDDKSEAEVQRFCQSYMTELSKYVGPGADMPSMGMGCGTKEIGYMYGQYKRVTGKVGNVGRGFLGGGQPNFPEANGYGVVHFADAMLTDKGDSLTGKRCLILGSGKVSQNVATKLLEYGAIPISFSDQSGHIYEPDGFQSSRLRTMEKVKNERGAKVGRYIIASTTCQYNEPANIFDIPCDLVFPCAQMGSITADDVKSLVESGCEGIIEGGHCSVKSDARKELKKSGMLYGPHTLTLAGAQVISGLEKLHAGRITDDMLRDEMRRIHKEVKNTSSEFNTRGDLHSGGIIMGFLRVANIMAAQGAV